ncbi:MAG: hypothetical protein RLP09_41800 [Sandaracinaceae bacterium]
MPGESSYDSPKLLHQAGSPPARLRFVEIEELLDRGGHLPVRCNLEYEDGTPAGSWVVKPAVSLGDGENREEASVLAELGGAEVAAWMGVPTPAIGLLLMPSGLTHDYFEAHGACESKLRGIFGVNEGRIAFCSRFLEDSAEWLENRHAQGQHGREVLQAYGPAVMLLDAYILHDDRTPEKPNVLEWRHRLVPIDHGSAFMGLDRDGGAIAQHIAAPRLHQLWRRHVFCSALSRARYDLDIDEAIETVAGVTDSVLEALVASWPDELRQARGRSGGILVDEMAAALAARRQHAKTIGDALVAYLRPSNG